MSDADDYALVDAGDGRRLERFGSRLVDRPAPAATEPRRLPDAWAGADLKFDRHGGWTGSSLDPWTIAFEGLTLELRPTEAGQVGLFPEHATAWPWLRERVAERPGSEVLHLFAYTGATTLALARAGARVAHVDASRPAIAWARRNAELSGLAQRPIRWLVDDAEPFVAREARRGRRYQGLVLDPPAWGHGGRRAWRLEDRLAELLDGCARLLDRAAWVLLTAHSVGWGADRLSDALRVAFDARNVESGELRLDAESGAVLSLGAFARVIIDR
jgi:23S rRNA (cytosine1962-C5)-methyltransferase